VFFQLVFPQEEMKFRHLGMKDGLSQSSVLEIFRDSEGFVWFGTRTGLNRYDGISVKEYLQDPDDPIAINFGFVLSIVEDEMSDLWIGSKGLYHYDRSLEKFTRYLDTVLDNQTQASNLIDRLEFDGSGNLWICHRGGLNLFDTTKKEFMPIFDIVENTYDIDPETIQDIEVDETNRIWFCTSTHLYRLFLEQKTLKQYSIPFRPSDNSNSAEVTLLHARQAGKLYIAGNNGQVFSFSETMQQVVNDELEIPAGYPVNCLAEDLDGNIIIGTNDGGLFKFDWIMGSLDQYTHDANNPYSLVNNLIYSVFPDQHGTVWIGTWDGGINYYNKYDGFFNWVAHNPKDENSLKSNDVTSFFEDDSARLWIGTWKGISCWNRSENDFCDYPAVEDPFNILDEAEVYCFFSLEPGRVWVGTGDPGGIFEIDTKNKQVRPLTFPWESSEPLKKSSVLSIVRYKGSDIWICTDEGAYRYNLETETYHLYNASNSGLKHNRIITTYMDSSGDFWVGSSSGLYLFDEQKNDFLYVSSYTEDSEFPDHWVYSIFEDDLGQFWVGTGGYGLVLYNRDNGDFRRFTVKDDLNSNVITGINTDYEGKLWISTYKGITEFNPNAKEVISNYDYSDGLHHIEFRPGCSYSTMDGDIVFGGSQGFTIFNPAEFIVNPHVPNIAFKELRIANKVIVPGRKKSPLKQALNHTDEIVLNFNQKHVSISFVALNLVDAPKNNYLCFLQGYDEEWYSPTSPGVVLFENLNPGRYTLQVKASNNSGIWNPSVKALKIRIKPPWYRTGLAYFLYVIVLGLILLLYARLIQYREKEKQKVLLERSEKEKIMALNKVRLQFFTGIAHDFKTPLALILSPIEQLQNYHSNDDKFERLIGIVSRNARRLNFLIAELMTFRKLEIGELKLNKQQVDVAEFLQGIASEFAPILKRRGIQLETQINGQQHVVSIDQDKMERVFYNLIDNACKYTPKGGIIRISCGSGNTEGSQYSMDQEGVYQVIVFNSGSPFTQEELVKVFERFYQGNDHKGSNQSYGIGLALVKGIVELHKGRISARNSGSEGKEFIIKLPSVIKENDFVYTETDDDLTRIQDRIETTNDSEVFILDDEPKQQVLAAEKPLVLIVDDNTELCNYLETNMGERFITATASDGKEGFTSATKQMPDLIISDIKMPKMDGLEFCQKIKSDIRTSHIPVILLTARSEIENRLEGLETGADAYITKPFEYRHLEVQVSNLIKNRVLLANKFSGKDPFKPDEIHSSKVDQEFLEKAIHFVYDNISETSLNIDNLSKHLCVSRRHLHRKVKVLTGSSPVEFISVIRLRKAMELIQEDSLSISEIGYRVGFNNPSYFANAFKKLYGHPPSFFTQHVN